MKFRITVGILACVVIGFVWGYVSHRNHVFPYQLWGTEEATDAQERKDSHAAARQIAKLAGLPYVGATNDPPTRTGVVVHDRARAYTGYNLFTTDEIPKATLMDMDGKVLHTWAYAYRDIWPDEEVVLAEEAAEWGGVFLYENGDLLATFEPAGLIKLDKASNLLWRFPKFCHHDLEVAEDGRIYVLTSEEKRAPKHLGKSYVDDRIAIMTAGGEPVEEVSILDAFRNSRYSSMVSHLKIEGDILHTNTIEILDGRLRTQSPAFEKGNILISMRNIDVIAVVNFNQKKVVWALSGMWTAQHHPTLLQNGNILLFDNQGHSDENEWFSKVIEFNPFTQRVHWSYDGNRRNGFYSEYLGRNQRFPNGNTLIVESGDSRCFEVTREKDVVWEFFNRRQVSDEDGRVVSEISSFERLEADFPLEWIEPGT